MSHYHHPSSIVAPNHQGAVVLKRRMRAVWLGAVEERRRMKGCRGTGDGGGGDGDDGEPCGVGCVTASIGQLDVFDLVQLSRMSNEH